MVYEYLFQFNNIEQAREVLTGKPAEHCTIIEHNPNYDLEGNSLNVGLHNSVWAVIFSQVEDHALYALAVSERTIEGGVQSVTRSKLAAGVIVSTGATIEVL